MGEDELMDLYPTQLPRAADDSGFETGSPMMPLLR